MTAMMSDGEWSHHLEKGPSEDFYDELQMSRMSNSKPCRDTSDGESIVERSMAK
jgi:hypothetical protein